MLAIIFVSYLAGGYVAGRMARFNGLKQGLGVWLWAVIIAFWLPEPACWPVLVSTSRPGQQPSAPPAESGHAEHRRHHLAIGIVAVSLIGALLGGLAGMRYHRRVDRPAWPVQTSAGLHTPAFFKKVVEYNNDAVSTPVVHDPFLVNRLHQSRRDCVFWLPATLFG